MCSREFHLPTTFAGLSIAEASEDGVRRLQFAEIASFSKDVKVFTVQGKDFLGHVAALIVDGYEDEGEYNEPIFFPKQNII
jgi:hypothetical protein